MSNVVQIKVGKHNTGIIGLDDALEEVVDSVQPLTDQGIETALLKLLSKKNYIPSTVVDLYKAAFLREYKKFIGEPVLSEPLAGIEIKVLGAGCPSCDQLEQNVMSVLEEIKIEANLEHIRDFKRISQYGVMALPSVVINGTVKALGMVPSKAQLKVLIQEAQSNLKKKQSP